ncbi:MAG: DDE-type integrase/transposase/recombinase [Bacteroidota bacterium]
MDIVGPLETPDTDLEKPRYLLTIIDSHTRWLEAVPLHDITTGSVAHAFLLNWVSRFGPPLYLTTDKGTQFTSEFIARLNDVLGIHHIRTSAYNPRANGMVERVHRTLKAALKSRGQHWLSQLPIVLFGLHMRPDEDSTSAFSRVTGEQPLVPHVIPPDFNLTQLAVELHKLPFAYTPTRERKIKTHMPEKLKTCSHAWLRVDRIRKPLEAPYQGPFEVVKRSDDTMTLKIRGKNETVSIDRVKPATLPAAKVDVKPVEEDETKPDTGAACEERENTTRSGRKVTFKQNPDFVYC